MVEREWFDKDYYKVLGLSSSATEKEITRAYRKLAKTVAPRYQSRLRGEVQRGSVAYDVLVTKRSARSTTRSVVSDRPPLVRWPGGPLVRAPVDSTSRPVTSETWAISSAASSVVDDASAPARRRS